MLVAISALGSCGEETHVSRVSPKFGQLSKCEHAEIGAVGAETKGKRFRG